MPVLSIGRKKAKTPKIDRMIPELIPIVDYDDLLGCFRLRDDRFLDIMQLECKNLATMSRDEKQIDILRYSKLYKTYSGDLKIVGINYPTDTTSQLAYLQHKLEQTENPFYKKRLSEKIREMEAISKNYFDREYFVFVFAADEAELRDNRNILMATLANGAEHLLRRIDKEKKIQLLSKINNKNTAFYRMQDETPAEPKKLKKVNNKKGYNPYLLHRIQPQGGISFSQDPAVVYTGDGYEACLHIWQYPKDVDDHWLSGLLNIQNVITTLDISTQNVEMAKVNLNKGMGEQELRFETARNNAEALDAKAQYQRLQALYHQVSNMGEMVKLIHVRLYISGNTREEIDNQIKNLQTYLEASDYRASVFLNETESEYAALYRTYGEQMQIPYRRIGQPVSSEALAAGYPFHFTSLSDPNGIYIGRTTVNGAVGNVLFNQFEKNSYRLSYSMVVAGATGSGKSTFLKKLLENNAICGNYIRGFDPVGDFTAIIHSLGGKIISLDGSDGILNALEIFQTGENDEQSYSRHLSKMSTILKFLAPGIDMFDSLEFSQQLDLLYAEWGLKPGWTGGRPITGRQPEEYPTFSDLLVLIRRSLNEIIDIKRDEMKLKRLQRIELIITDLVNNYGHIFNGHTSIPDLLSTQVVYFNIRNLAQMKPEIFDAQIFNAINLTWDNLMKIGMPMKQKWEDGEIAWEDITRFLLIFDESHKTINANKLHALELLTTYVREARKFFGGLILASQSIRDYVPENSNSQAVDQMKTMFEQMQYKVIMRQDSNALSTLRTVFQSQFTDTEIDRIPSFEQGVCLMGISSYKTVEFKVDVSQSELKVYRGGA